jgi:hypothetical protein
MKFILEYKRFFQEGDIVLIEYWYNGMVTPVKIVEKKGRNWLVSHNCEGSKINNAPDEVISTKSIISIRRD